MGDRHCVKGKSQVGFIKEFLTIFTLGNFFLPKTIIFMLKIDKMCHVIQIITPNDALFGAQDRCKVRR